MFEYDKQYIEPVETVVKLGYLFENYSTCCILTIKSFILLKKDTMD